MMSPGHGHGHPSVYLFVLTQLVQLSRRKQEKNSFPLDDDGDDSTQVSEILRMGKPYSNRCRRSTLKYQIREQPRLLFFECLLPILALVYVIIAPLFTFFQVITNLIHPTLLTRLFHLAHYQILESIALPMPAKDETQMLFVLSLDKRKEINKFALSRPRRQHSLLAVTARYFIQFMDF